MPNKSPEAQAWSTILGVDVVAVYRNVPIIEAPSGAELREDLLRWNVPVEAPSFEEMSFGTIIREMRALPDGVRKIRAEDFYGRS